MPEKLFIATPVYERSLTLDYHTSAIETVAACYREGISVYPNYVSSPAGGAGGNILRRGSGDRLHDAVHRFRHRMEAGIADAPAVRDARSRRYRSAGGLLSDEDTLLQFPVWFEHPPV